jgi:hypothetical protein
VDFIRGNPGRKRDLELALLADIERLMTALGKGLSFYGRQLALLVGGASSSSTCSSTTILNAGSWSSS